MLRSRRKSGPRTNDDPSNDPDQQDESRIILDPPRRQADEALKSASVQAGVARSPRNPRLLEANERKPALVLLL